MHDTNVAPGRRLGARRQRVLIVILATAVAAAITAGALLLRPEDRGYRPGDDLEGLTSQLDRDGAATGRARPTFVDVTAAAGVDFRHFGGERSSQLPEDMGSGAAWGDFDGDGLVDLYLVAVSAPMTATTEDRAASDVHSKLFRNLGGGRFDDVTDETSTGIRGIGQGAAFGDVDRDGDLDLVITTYGSIHLLVNERGAFADRSTTWGVADERGFWTGATFLDFDRDGHLDLYVCGYVEYRDDPELRATKERQYQAVVPASLNPSTFSPQRNLLFHNVDGVRFEEVAETAGVRNDAGRSLSAAAADFDDDGWPDLYIANDISDNVLYRNLGDGTFVDVSHEALVADYRGAMGLAVGDWDRDGDLDIFVSHWVAQENALYANTRSETSQPAGSPLRFADAADMNGLGQASIPFVGWGTAFLDFDRDGRLDLFVVNGHTIPTPDDARRLQPMRSMLYWNAGVHEGFYDVAEHDPELAREVVARGMAVADFDLDGDPDVVVNVHGGGARLLRNDTSSTGHWLTLRLRGTQSNTFAVGARVRLEAGGVIHTRELGATSSYLSQSTVGEELFGLGETTTIDAIEVRWPGGEVERAGPFDVDNTLTWVEGTPPTR